MRKVGESLLRFGRPSRVGEPSCGEERTRRLRGLRCLWIATLSVLAGCGFTPEPVVSSLPAPGLANGPVDDSDDVDKTTLDGGRTTAANVVPASNTCAAQSFQTRRLVPDMIIVLDRSSSMQSGSVDRWTPAVAAIKSLTATFDQGVSFGLMIFPALDASCSPGAVDVPIGPGNASTIARALAKTAPFGATPTGETLQAALATFRLRSATSTSAPPPRYVLLVTDGEPTCPNAEGFVGRLEGLAADKQVALQAIDALRAEGVQTYVLGYDALQDLRFAGTLTEFAQHGGTEHYYLVQDEASLLATLDSIADAVVNCSFDFAADTTDVDPSLVHVTLNGMTLRPNDPNGWSIQGRTVTVRGEACQRLQQAQDQKIDIALECAPVVYL